MANLVLALEYEWEPFTVDGRHLTFVEHRTARLYRGRCSHWGAAVYKWEGVVREGPHTGKIGVLIGETDDIRQRIKQYASGTQKGGNVYWRENFLEKGDIRLYVLRLGRVQLRIDGQVFADIEAEDFSSGNRRVVYEQLLVMEEVERSDPEVWLVNRKL